MWFWIGIVGTTIYLMVGSYLSGLNNSQSGYGFRKGIGAYFVITLFWIFLLIWFGGMELCEWIWEKMNIANRWKSMKYNNKMKLNKLKSKFVEIDPFDETDNDIDEDRLKRMGLDTRTDIWTSELETENNGWE